MLHRMTLPGSSVSISGSSMSVSVSRLDPTLLREGNIHRRCTIGGFYVSNLMGIKRRMIDIGKKITLIFAKCLKMYSFFEFAFKVFKKN
jgi:hypothetical protein